MLRGRIRSVARACVCVAARASLRSRGGRSVLDLLAEAVPGSIRKAEHFIAFLRRLLAYLKARVAGRAPADGLGSCGGS